MRTAIHWARDVEVRTDEAKRAVILDPPPVARARSIRLTGTVSRAITRAWHCLDRCIACVSLPACIANARGICAEGHLADAGPVRTFWKASSTQVALLALPSRLALAQAGATGARAVTGAVALAQLGRAREVGPSGIALANTIHAGAVPRAVEGAQGSRAVFPRPVGRAHTTLVCAVTFAVSQRKEALVLACVFIAIFSRPAVVAHAVAVNAHPLTSSTVARAELVGTRTPSKSREADTLARGTITHAVAVAILRAHGSGAVVA